MSISAGGKARLAGIVDKRSTVAWIVRVRCAGLPKVITWRSVSSSAMNERLLLLAIAHVPAACKASMYSGSPSSKRTCPDAKRTGRTPIMVPSWLLFVCRMPTKRCSKRRRLETLEIVLKRYYSNSYDVRIRPTRAKSTTVCVL